MQDSGTAGPKLGGGVHLTCETGSIAGPKLGVEFTSHARPAVQLGGGVHLTCKTSSTAGPKLGVEFTSHARPAVQLLPIQVSVT